jgi:hypothetical protein
MTTSLGDLLDALIADAASDSTDVASPARRADAGCAVGHLGRALTHLRTDGVATVYGTPRDRSVLGLASACAVIAMRAPVIEQRLTQLAAAAADTAGLLRRELSVDSRWAIAVEMADTIETLAAVISDGSASRPDGRAELHRRCVEVQMRGALEPANRNAAAALDRPVPGGRARRGEAGVDEAMAVLVGALAPRAATMSAIDVRACSVAAHEIAAALLAVGEHPSTIIATGAGWRAVRAAVQPFHDGTPASRDIVAAVRNVRAAVDDLVAGPLSPRGVAALATASQYLPAAADHLHVAVETWAARGTLTSYACQLPRRADRLEQILAGRRPAGIVHPDATDLRPVTDALHHAKVLSTDLASQSPSAAGEAVPRLRRTQAVTVSRAADARDRGRLSRAAEEAARIVHSRRSDSAMPGRGIRP